MILQFSAGWGHRSSMRTISPFSQVLILAHAISMPSKPIRHTEVNGALEEYGGAARCFNHGTRWIQRKCGYTRKFRYYGAGCYQVGAGAVLYTYSGSFIVRSNTDELVRSHTILPVKHPNACRKTCEIKRYDRAEYGG